VHPAAASADRRRDAATKRERSWSATGARQFVGQEAQPDHEEPGALTRARVGPRRARGSFIARRCWQGYGSPATRRAGDMIINAHGQPAGVIIETESGARLIGSGSDPGNPPYARVSSPATGASIASSGPRTSRGSTPRRSRWPESATGRADDRGQRREKVAARAEHPRGATAPQPAGADKTGPAEERPGNCMIVGGGRGGAGDARLRGDRGALDPSSVEAVALGGQGEHLLADENYLRLFHGRRLRSELRRRRADSRGRRRRFGCGPRWPCVAGAGRCVRRGGAATWSS